MDNKILVNGPRKNTTIGKLVKEIARREKIHINRDTYCSYNNKALVKEYVRRAGLN